MTRSTPAPITRGTFTVSGVPIDALYPRRRSVTWNHGTISGDPVMVAAARDRATAFDGHHVGPVEGPVTDRDHLSSDISAVMILAALFVAGTVEVTGDVPARIAPPDRLT
jgi:hypothetical protein